MRIEIGVASRRPTVRPEGSVPSGRRPKYRLVAVIGWDRRVKQRLTCFARRSVAVHKVGHSVAEFRGDFA
jgi:hypothetical protein